MGRELYKDNKNPLYSDYNIVKKYKNEAKEYKLTQMIKILIETGNIISIISFYFYVYYKLYISKINIFFNKLALFIILSDFLIIFFKNNNIFLKIKITMTNLLIKLIEFCLSIIISLLMKDISFDSCILISILIIIYYLSFGNYMIDDINSSKINWMKSNFYIYIMYGLLASKILDYNNKFIFLVYTN